MTSYLSGDTADLRRFAAAASVLALALTAAACTAEQAGDGEATDVSSEAIVNGKVASAYPEAALIDTQDFICSGTVIAPRVALTAGHCVVGASEWRVTTPFSKNQTALGHSSFTQYKATGESVNGKTIDVAVIILDTPINLASYPTLATAPVADGTKGVNIGRIKNDQASFTRLFAGTSVSLSDATSEGFPLDYVAKEIIESGDSGGGVYVGTGASRKIVAVNSGAGGGTEVLARVDLIVAKIKQIIAANP
jgi:V8-like Glu-specific endopeptidase